jgi:hypothetical protein
MAEGDATEAEARAILALEKFMPPDIDIITWERKPQNAAFMVFSCPLVDADGITIQGLRAELEFRVPVRFDDCKYRFSIFKFTTAGPQRVYQLEVIPEDECGHRGEDHTPCYGPHEHIGMLVKEVRIAKLDCRHHEKWFWEFTDRAKIGYSGRYFGPFDGALFRDL